MCVCMCVQSAHVQGLHEAQGAFYMHIHILDFFLLSVVQCNKFIYAYILDHFNFDFNFKCSHM